MTAKEDEAMAAHAEFLRREQAAGIAMQEGVSAEGAYRRITTGRSVEQSPVSPGHAASTAVRAGEAAPEKR